MSSLDSNFDELLAKIRDPDTLNPAKSDPVLYFVYPPELMLDLKQRLPRWMTKIRDAGFKVQRFSLSEILWRLIDASGRWETWLELEHDADIQQLNEAIRDVLRQQDSFIKAVAEVVCSASADTVLFLTEAELLHPYFRTRIIENRLHDRVIAPTVIFYPSRCSGQCGLHFLGFYKVDSNYRSTLLGGS